MKIQYYKYDVAETVSYLNRFYKMYRSEYEVTEGNNVAVSSLTSAQKGYSSQYAEIASRTGCLFDGHNRISGVPLFTSDAEVTFENAIFRNVPILITATAVIRQTTFKNCIFDNVGFCSANIAGDMIFENCIFRDCFNDTRFRFMMTDCIMDRKYGNENSEYTNIIVGNPMFISDDTSDLWDTNTNPDGIGYCRMFKWRGYDYNAPNSAAGAFGIPTNHNVMGNPHYWTPSYACNESKRIVLFNNQDYVDLDGNRRNYFDKTINEITLDFTKNGLTKEDMAAVKDIYENSDNEITIYPDENDMTNYIVGRLSKSDLDYSKMINSYWDNGKIDDERFNGVRMVIRVTDDSHFTRSV